MSRLIAFDVDSTLLRVESLDMVIEAALTGMPDSNPARDQLHEITQAGMTGKMALRESLEARLALAALDKALIVETADLLRQRITPGMKPLLKTLRDAGDQVHAISGGFRDLLDPVLDDMGFGPSERHTNKFVFDGDQVSGLNTDYPLSKNGGKAEILRQIAGQADQVVIVGDGMTDFEAFEMGAAHRFIGFGGIAARDVVIAAAEWAGADYARTVDALSVALRRQS